MKINQNSEKHNIENIVNDGEVQIITSVGRDGNVCPKKHRTALNKRPLPSHRHKNQTMTSVYTGSMKTKAPLMQILGFKILMDILRRSKRETEREQIKSSEKTETDSKKKLRETERDQIES